MRSFLSKVNFQSESELDSSDKENKPPLSRQDAMLHRTISFLLFQHSFIVLIIASFKNWVGVPSVSGSLLDEKEDGELLSEDEIGS